MRRCRLSGKFGTSLSGYSQLFRRLFWCIKVVILEYEQRFAFYGQMLANPAGGLAMHKILLAAVTSFALSASAGSGIAFPSAPIHAAQSLPNVQQVTFWGRPFPYGYNWSLVRACTRYEPVETADGTRMQRVWVCGDRRRYYYR